MNVSAIILAGGKSSRMNYQNKALLSFKGKNFMEILINELTDVADEVLISQQELQQKVTEGYTIVNDNFPDCGLLSGIEAGLTYCKNESLIVAACDMPMLNKELFYILLQHIENYDAVIPVVNGKTEPLAAIYQKKSLKEIRSQLRQGVYCVKTLLEQLNVRYIDGKKYGFNADNFKNINTTEAYETFLQEQGEWIWRKYH
ncbi:molybdenum cofactor guanylyltransferase [Clostridium sp. Marseille-P2415]|uniref:molybdenum cofactor guanylyltransferase n=1 Tax=Clostridium sp. Marseille-P2415 TaxID=1805471 RepID=UPI00098855D2|nr:molybdenum cofactor guanylyltransferase [Clostridium sp. Marseille-P2415]